MRCCKSWVCVLSVAGVVAVASSALAVTVTLRDGLDGYAGTHDATLMENAGGTTYDYRDDGGRFVQESWGSTLPTSSPPYDTTYRWSTGLLRFEDLFASMPAGSMIGSASLTVEVTNPIEGTHLAVMTTAWDESTITWDTFGSGSPEFGGGVTPGVEADSSLTSLGTLGYGQHDIDVTSTVQSWLDNSGTNYGWAFLRNDKNKGLFVASEDTVDVTQRPTLTIEFTPIPEPASAVIWAFAGVGLLGLMRRRRSKWGSRRP